MPDGNGFIEKDTLEVRAETLTIRCAGKAQRRGDSDRLEIGDTAALDVVAGEESLHAKGGLTERTEGSASTRASRLKTTVNGRLKVSGRSETTFLGGAMADSQAGAMLVAAGMSDDLVIGGGARATVPVDIWLAGLIGMEEKVGTAAADGVLMECYRTLFEREYGSGTHVAGVAVFSGALHVTAKAGFRPMMKALRGIRNLTPGGGGGGGGGGGSAPPTPPPVPPSEAGTGLLGGFRGASDVEDADDLPRFSEHVTHAEDLANATETASAREARTTSWFQDLQVLRRASEQDDTEEALAILRRLRGDDAVASQRPTYVDFNARYYLSMDADGRYMLHEDPGGPYQLAAGSDGSIRAIQDPEAEFTAAKDLRRYDLEMGPDGRYRLIDPNASDSEPAHWLHSVGFGEHADDPGHSPIAGDAPQRLDDPADPGHALPFANDGPGDSRAGNPSGTHPSERPADPRRARIDSPHLEPAPLDGPGADSRGGPIATIEIVDQRSYVVAAEGGDLTRRPIGPSSGADETSRGQIYATVIQDPTTNQGVATHLMTPAGDDSSRVLLDIDVEQLDLEHVGDARDLPSPGRLSDGPGEGARPGMQLGDRGPGWEDPDLLPVRSASPDDTLDPDRYRSADILHGLPGDLSNQPSDPPAVSRFYGGEPVPAPLPAATPSGGGADHRLSASIDTTGAIQRLGEEIALQTEEIRRVRDGGGSADDLRHLEAEREARRLALSEMQAGRDPRPALRTQAAEAREPHRTQAFTDLVDYFGGAGQFSPQGTSPRTGGLHGRIPSSLDPSALLAGWREQVGALSEAADRLNPRTAAEIERAEALSDTESWMRHAIVMIANRQDPSDELLRHAADLEARTFADGATGAGEASMLHAMTKEYQDLLEEYLTGYPIVSLQLDEVETLPGGSPRSFDAGAEVGRPGQDVPVDNARWDLRDDIYDAFRVSSPERGTALADPGSDLGRHLAGEDYWGMQRGLSLLDSRSSGNVTDTATGPVRVPSHGERGVSLSESKPVVDGMEAAFDGSAGAPPSSSSPPSSDRYRIAMEYLDEVLDAGISTSERTEVENVDDIPDTDERPGGATPAPTAATMDRKVRWGDPTALTLEISEAPRAVESGQPSRSRINFMEKYGFRKVGDARIPWEMGLARHLSETRGLDEMTDPQAWREYHRLYPAEAEELWESMWYSKETEQHQKGPTSGPRSARGRARTVSLGCSARGADLRGGGTGAEGTP